MTRGQFVVAFPFYGGWSAQRVRRAVWPQIVEMAIEQGVTIKGEPTYRVDRTPTGAFLVVQAPAVSQQPLGEVRAHAEYLAYAHEAAHPALARWIGQRLGEVAA